MIIKKYDNRRLYASDLSRYVTLEELRQRVLSGKAVSVLYYDRDITAEVYARILVADTLRGLIGPESLAELIRKAAAGELES